MGRLACCDLLPRRWWTRPQRACRAARPVMRCPPPNNRIPRTPTSWSRGETAASRGRTAVPDRAPDDRPGDEPVDPDRHPGKHPGRHHAGGDADGADIPLPRRPLDDHPALGHADTENTRGGLPENGSVEPIWRYDQTWKRGKRHRYNGYVDRIGGVEGKRLREGLAAAIRDLLDWAASQQAAQQVENVDSDRESGPDSRRDGGTDETPT